MPVGDPHRGRREFSGRDAVYGQAAYCLWGGFGRAIDQQQLLALAALDPEVDVSSVSRSPQAGGAFAQPQHRRVGFKPDPLLEARVIEQSNASAELRAESLEKAGAARTLLPKGLAHSMLRFVSTPSALSLIEHQFSMGDPPLVRGAIFELLRTGQLHAPSLHNQPLSLHTLLEPAA